MGIAFIVAQADVAQCDVFHEPAFFADLYCAPMMDLTLKQNEEAIEITFDQVLRSQTHSNSDHTSRSRNRAMDISISLVISMPASRNKYWPRNVQFIYTFSRDFECPQRF